MVYAITPDLKIHHVINKEIFYKHNPDAQDITLLKGVYEQFCEQEIKEKKAKNEVTGITQLKNLTKKLENSDLKNVSKDLLILQLKEIIQKMESK